MLRILYLSVKVLVVPEAPENLPLLRRAPVGDGREGGEEPGQLLLPIVQGGGGGNHQEGTPHPVALRHVRQERQRLGWTS
jgi:hypothetical protein